MKKILTKFLPLLLLISLMSCNQLVVGIEKTFSYWANGATIIGIELPPNLQVDGDGFSSLPSSQDACICFKLNNPQKFEFLMPNGSNAPADIIVFDENVKGKNGGRPKFGEGEDYSLIQKDSDTLELTYKKEFLLKNEQGKANLNPKIKLYNKKDNRRFAQNYNYKLRANTVPPKPEWFTTGKIQQGTDWYYVLIFKFEGLTNSIDIENFLHKDISEVLLTEVGTQKAPIQIKLKNNGFDVSDSQGNLIPADKEIKPLAPTDLTGGGPTSFEPIPAANSDDRKWMLCIKTGVKTGDSLSYKVKVKDLRGLPSEETSGVTNAAKLPVPQISYDSEMAALTSSGVYMDNEPALNNHSSSSTNPILISSCFGKTVVLKAHNTAYPSDVTIEAEVKLSASTPAPSGFAGPKGSSQLSGNTTKILLDPIPGVDEIYEVKVKASASGSNYTDSDEKTYYYQIKKEVRAGTSSWQILKKAVNLASDRDTIYINGHIKSTSTANNSGEIEVDKNINIKGSTGKTNDIIDANRIGPDNPSPTHRIFNIKNGGSLNLTGLTLQDGKVEGSTYEATGGAIKAGNGSVLTLDNTDIADSEAGMAGGAISSTGNIGIKGNSVIRNNKTISPNGLGGAIYNGGTLKISGSAQITVDAAKNDVYLPAEKVITVTGVLTQTSVARITPANNTYSTGRQVVKGASGVTLSSQVSKFKVSDDTDGKKWKINTDGKLELANKTITVTSWKELKKAVKEGENNTILVDSNLTAAYGTDEENYGTIEIEKNMTIKGNNTSSQNVIELDLTTFTGSGRNKKHKIFKISNNAVVKLENLELKNGYSTDSGGGIDIASGNVTLSKVTIDNCTAKSNGGGIAVRGGSLKIKNGSLIQNCKASKDTTSSLAVANGGGIFVGEHGTLELDGIRIYKNSADKNDGGGIYTKGTTSIVSATIEENSSISSGGGGIYIEDGTCTIGNTATGNIIIKNNKSDLGAGIYINRGTLDIQRGLIENNSTEEGTGFKYGGGLYLANGTVNMSGGEIKTNSAGIGGAVYFENGTFNISGVAKITPSITPNENAQGQNDVYLSDDKKIKITGTLTAGQNQAARITVPDANYTEGTVVLEGEGTVNLSNEAKKFKVTKKESQNWYVGNNGQLTTTAPSP
ncbi:hypothetical protein HO345_02405 [Treponema denticola]|uniref:pectate lyase-like adhesive domain-containing protein n=1 Tax=Treponema denticola TaxID=158 RepID=UPI0020A5BDE2|nr:pectate lyase-like adhesive domain-containing protein [Treponema denticola]UTD11919.1 hypothetical protein HO345_02405 [Treponema denticola]